MGEHHRLINQLELLAVHKALEQSPSLWSNKRVLIATDNSTVVAYINNQGGTRSMPMLDLTLSLLHWAWQKHIVLKARHIPGRLNRTADLLSRSDWIVNTEWTMSQQLLKLLWKVWGRPQVDLLATSLTTRLPLYVSPYPDPKALAVDAMSITWKGLDAYVFPPWALIADVLAKARQETCLLTIIVPR